MPTKENGFGLHIFEVILLALVFLEILLMMFPQPSVGVSSAAAQLGPLIFIVVLIPYLPFIGISLVPALVISWLIRKDFRVRKILRYTICLIFVIWFSFPIFLRSIQ